MIFKTKQFLKKIFFKKLYETQQTSMPISFKILFFQKILGFNRKAYWPMHFTSFAAPIENISIGLNTAPGLSRGCYINAIGKVKIGDYTFIGPNVGIISANHDIYNLKKHIKSEISIGNYCWIGMNSTILPNIKLGDFTIVGAGSVVTKSFENGYCIIAGNPAKIIRNLDKDKCVPYKDDYEYYGYLTKNEFNQCTGE